jgi:hypothetical protein
MTEATTIPQADDKPLGQQYHEAVEALKSEGMGNADAIREVASRFGKEVNAIRGGIFQYKKAHGAGGSTSTTVRRVRKKAEATVDDLLANARKAIEDALALVDREPEDLQSTVQRLQRELDAAQSRYEEAVAAAKGKKAELEKKLKALS